MLHSCMITGSSARGSSCEMSHADRSCCSQKALFTLPYKTRHMPSSAVQRKKKMHQHLRVSANASSIW